MPTRVIKKAKKAINRAPSDLLRVRVLPNTLPWDQFVQNPRWTGYERPLESMSFIKEQAFGLSPRSLDHKVNFC